MTHVALIGVDATSHEDWDDAVQHVATATGSSREAIWIFHGLREGALVFAAPVGECHPPVAWIASPQQYQAAKSRGDLEDLSDAPSLFYRRAGGLTLRPGSTPQDHTTMKALLTPKTSSKQPGKRMSVSPRAKKNALDEKPAAERKTVQPAVETTDGSFKLLSPRAIAPSPVNPRREFDQDALDELVDSVREKGVRVAINVRPMPAGSWIAEPAAILGKGKWQINNVQRPLMASQLPGDIMQTVFDSEAEARAALPRYELIAGERRWRAARLAGSGVIRAIVEAMDDVQAAELQVIENDQREDLTPMEAAAGYKFLLDQPGYSMEMLVQRLGKAKNTIYGRLKLLELPETVQTAVARGTLPAATAELIARLEPEIQEKAAKEIVTPHNHWGGGKAEPLSFRAAKEVIAEIKGEKKAEDLRAEVKRVAEARGLTVLEGEMAKGVIPYSDHVAHNCGYVAASAVCERDPRGRKWKEIVESAAVKEAGVVVSRLAVIANGHREGFKAVEVFARDQVNVMLKALGLWEVEGSKKSQEKAEKAAAKEKAGQDREDMMWDMDVIMVAAEHERSPRNALLAAVWAATQEFDNTDAAEFVAKRRAWLSLDGNMSEACSVVRSMATDLEVNELQGLVVELAIAQMDEEECYFSEGRDEMRRLLNLEFSGRQESAGARTEGLEEAAA